MHILQSILVKEFRPIQKLRDMVDLGIALHRPPAVLFSQEANGVLIPQLAYEWETSPIFTMAFGCVVLRILL